MESSAVGAKVKKSVILATGRMIPPQLRRRSLSLTVSHRAEQNLVYRDLLRTSLNENASAMASMVEGSRGGVLVPDLCGYWSAQATKTRRSLDVSSVWPSNPE
jgi:hypothetical protein